MIGWLARWWHLRLQRRQVARWHKDVDHAVRRWERAQKAVSLDEWHRATHEAALRNAPRPRLTRKIWE